jgi:regulator of protease activity HflC (stomatin/prohibitin superfamily)
LPGIEICALDILSIHPPVEVAAVFLDQISARIDAERVEMSARGDSLTEHQRSEMMAYSTVADAKAAASKRLTAVTDEHAYVSALAAVDLNAPAVVRRRAFCSAMLEALEHKPFVLLETSLQKSVRLWFQSSNAIDGKAGVAP